MIALQMVIIMVIDHHCFINCTMDSSEIWKLFPGIDARPHFPELRRRFQSAFAYSAKRPAVADSPEMYLKGMK